MIKTKLQQSHYDHLIDESFTPEEILELEGWGVRSIDLSEALKLGIKKWDGFKHVSDGGLYFPFSAEYGQVRLNTPITVQEKGKLKTFKYLGPSKPTKVWYPCTDVQALTEGWKDAAIPTVRGVPTGAIAGIWNVIHCVPQGCEIPIIFDSDVWCKPHLVHGLVQAGVWTQGRINLFPEMEAYPKGGACEFFKSGGTIADYQELIDEAMPPAEFLGQWVNHWERFDQGLRSECAYVAERLSLYLEMESTYIKELESQAQDKIAEWLGKTKG